MIRRTTLSLLQPSMGRPRFFARSTGISAIRRCATTALNTEFASCLMLNFSPSFGRRSLDLTVELLRKRHSLETFDGLWPGYEFPVLRLTTTLGRKYTSHAMRIPVNDQQQPDTERSRASIEKAVHADQSSSAFARDVQRRDHSSIRART